MKHHDIVRYSIHPFITEESIKFWFDFFNVKVFKKSLKFFDGIKIGGDLSDKLWGCLSCSYYDDGDDSYLDSAVLEIQPYLEFGDFLGTLCHEMVHLFQGQVQKNFAFPEPEDDITFQVFEDRLKPFGITIL
jgi:hypothetical protein